MTDGTTTVDTPEMEHDTTDDSSSDAQVQEVNYEEKYKSLQADYTKKAQELAELKKKEDSTAGLTPDEQQLQERLRSQGFTSKEDLERSKNQIMEETQFNSLLQDYPKLKDNEEAIRDLQKIHGGSFEEIAIKYKFTTSDELNKLKSSRTKMVGADSKQPPKTKSIKDLTSEEYAEWKAKNISESGSFDKVDGF